MKCDITIDFKYDIEKGEPFDLETNAKPEAMEEILSEYLRSHMGNGKDESKPEERKVYHIIVGLDLSDDSFGTYSNTGNKSLTDGIVGSCIGQLEQLAKQS